MTTPLNWLGSAARLACALALSATSTGHLASLDCNGRSERTAAATAPTDSTPIINVPRFPGEIDTPQSAVLWFGRVTRTENYADVRLGYTDDELYVYVLAIDRLLWYDDTSPSPADLTQWDAATLFLNRGSLDAANLDADCYRFVGQLNWWEQRDAYQTAYTGDGGAWVSAPVPFTATSGWRGVAPNDGTPDKGWELTFHIPFSSLGMTSGPPATGTTWSLAFLLHDRDDAAGSPIPDQVWPDALAPDSPATWGHLRFGQPTYVGDPVVQETTTVIRHKLSGANVVDGAVGGGTNCAIGLDYWDEWGTANYAGDAHVNIQNQSDISDYPCFSKFYVTFPLDSIPRGQIIISAKLTLHQFGNAGGGEWDEPLPSLIQVFTVAQDWDEATLTWNNAPLAFENVAAAWVDPLPSFPGWPGVPRDWDVSRAAAEAYQAGQPLRLAMYSADTAYHSGKYFVSSDTGDWNAVARPTLTVVWGQQAGTVDKSVTPAAPAAGGTVTYSLRMLGSGRAMTLTDSLPAEVGAPGPLDLDGTGIASYAAGEHRVSWVGTPITGEPITLSFPVTVLASGPLAVRNTAELADGRERTVTSTATFVVDALSAFLPAILRDA
jgi:hypothetical protein